MSDIQNQTRTEGDETELISSLVSQLDMEKHIHFLTNLNQQDKNLEYWHSQHLKLSAVYWSIVSSYILNQQTIYPKLEILQFVKSCYDPKSGGFGGLEGYDGHILYTLSAIQILSMYRTSLCSLGLDILAVLKFVKGLVHVSGGFCGDKYGEVDTRFVYAALSCLSLLEALFIKYEQAQLSELQQVEFKLELEGLDTSNCLQFLLQCRNLDGGFGAVPNSESHAGQIFCCVSSLAILNQIEVLETSGSDQVLNFNLGWWLAERQLPCGGFNGRPEKLEDVCYSWWVLSSLHTLQKVHWIDKVKLIQFILNCQDPVQGGFSDRPDNISDVFHTLFGLTGLSLLDFPNLAKINAIYCLPQTTVDELGL